MYVTTYLGGDLSHLPPESTNSFKSEIQGGGVPPLSTTRQKISFSFSISIPLGLPPNPDERVEVGGKEVDKEGVV
jgi:hypothetical protein